MEYEPSHRRHSGKRSTIFTVRAAACTQTMAAAQNSASIMSQPPICFHWQRRNAPVDRGELFDEGGRSRASHGTQLGLMTAMGGKQTLAARLVIYEWDIEPPLIGPKILGSAIAAETQGH